MKIKSIEIARNNNYCSCSAEIKKVKKHNNIEMPVNFNGFPLKPAQKPLDKFAGTYIMNLRYKVSELVNEMLEEKQTTNADSLILCQMKGMIGDGLNEAVTYIIGRFFRTTAGRIENYIGKQAYRPYITDVYSIIGNKEELLFQIRNGKIEVMNLLQTKHDLLKPEERNMLEFLAEPSKDTRAKLTLRQKANLGLHGIL